MLNKIELKDRDQIRKIELKLKKNNQTEIHKKTYWFLFILILICLISFSTSVMLHYCIEDLFPDVSMSKLFLDINSENDITGKTYRLDKYNSVISMSHTTWNGLPEYTQNSNIAKLLDQNNSISCYKCCDAIPTIDKKCIIENDNFFNNGVHNNLWFNIRDIKPHLFKYQIHNTYDYECQFQYVSRSDIRKFYYSINEKTNLLDITSKVINFGRSLHIPSEESSFRCDIISKYKEIIFLQNHEIANTISYKDIIGQLKDKITNILSYSNLDKEDLNTFSDIVLNRLLGVTKYKEQKDKQSNNLQNKQFILTRSQSEIDMNKINKTDLITQFKSFSVDIGSANRKIFTILNTIAKAIGKSNILLITESQEYGNINYDCLQQDHNSINKEIIKGSKLVVEHCAKKMLNPTSQEELNNLHISYKNEQNSVININLYTLITNIVANDHKLDNSFEKFKLEFIKMYNREGYYRFIESLYEIVLFPIFKVVDNKFGEDIKKLSVKSHNNNKDILEISSNLSQNLVPNKILKLSDNSNNYRLMLHLIDIEDLNLEELANLINFNYLTSYNWHDIINTSNISTTIPNLIATDIIRFIDTDSSILRTVVKDKLKKLSEYLSIMYHWNYIISDLNKFKHVPDNQTILPNIDIKQNKLESSISLIKYKKNSFFSKKISNSLIPKNIYELMVSHNVIFECYMNMSNIIKFNNLPGFNIIGLDILLEELTSYVLRTNVYNYGIQFCSNGNSYIDKIKYIRSRDLYLVSLPYERFMDIKTKEKNYIFSKINQIPHLIYNDSDYASSMFFIVSKKTKKAICVDPISCIFGSIVSESTRYSKIAKIVHEIIYPISSNKSNMPRMALNLLMPDFKFKDNFYIRSNNYVISSLKNVLTTNLKLVMQSISNVQYFDITYNNNNIQIKFISNKNLTHEFLHSYVNNFNESVNLTFEKSPSSFITQALFDCIRKNNLKGYNPSILDLLSLSIKSIKDIPKISVYESKPKELTHEILFTIKDLDRNKMSDFCDQINKSENDIYANNYEKYQKYIESANVIHLAPMIQKDSDTNEENREKSNFEKEEAELVKKVARYVKNFDASYGNKCKSGNKVSHLRLKLIDKLHQITSLFFSD